MSNDPIEQLLRSTASETRTAIADADFGDIPPFEPNNNRGGALVAAIAVLLIVGFGGWLVTRSSGEVTDLETAEPTEIENDELPDTQVVEQDPQVDAECTTSTTTTTTTVAPVVDLEVREQAEVDKPAVGESYVDPAFGTTITRATNSAPDEHIVPVQSPAATWNADESLLLLYQTGARASGHIIVDASTFDVVGDLPLMPTDIEHVFWHPTDPDLIVTTVDLELVTVSASTGEVTTIASFPQCDSVDPGIGSAGPSWDGRIIALRCVTADSLSVLSQPLDGSTAASLDVAEGQQGMASADGESIVIETVEGFDIYDSALTELRSTIQWEASSPTVGVDGDGNSIIVSAGFEADFNGVLVTAAVDGDAPTVEVIVGPDAGYPSPRSGTRTSATSWAAPGILVAASPLPTDVQNGGPFETFDGEVVVADLSTTPPTVRRVAHTRNFGDDPFSAAFVSISPTGRFVAFASDFGADSTDTYIIDLDGGS